MDRALLLFIWCLAQRICVEGSNEHGAKTTERLRHWWLRHFHEMNNTDDFAEAQSCLCACKSNQQKDKACETQGTSGRAGCPHDRPAHPLSACLPVPAHPQVVVLPVVAWTEMHKRDKFWNTHATSNEFVSPAGFCLLCHPQDVKHRAKPLQALNK